MKSLRTLTLVVGVMMTLFVALLILGACGGGNSANADPYAPFRPALKPDYQGDFDSMDKAPRYYVTVTMTPTGDLLTGSTEVDVTNYSPDTWRYLIFRLYPALQQYGGEMTILSVAVASQPTNFTYEEQNTAIRIIPAKPLEPDDKVRVHINYRLTIPKWKDDTDVYALFGRSQQMTSLPLFYPSLAVYQVDPAVGSGAWWLDTGTARGDSAFNVASLFAVTATLPSNEVPVAPGTLVGSTSNGQGQTRYEWVTGPVREFILQMSPNFSSASAEAYGTRITSYWLPGQEAAGRDALHYAVSALRIYSDYYGPYSAREMSVVEAPLTYRGMEYPQVNLLGVGVYTSFQKDMEILVAHEVAHQWWYQVVHNDPVNMPWLDEALAEYSVKIYYERLHGPQEAALLQRQRWQTPYDLLVSQDQDSPLNRSVDSFDDGHQYETIIYGKGALFYAKLREILGDRRFQRFLREYFADHRYQIVNTDSWHEELQKLQLPEAESLFNRWVGSTQFVPPTPTPEPTEERSGDNGGTNDSGGAEKGPPNTL